MDFTYNDDLTWGNEGNAPSDSLKSGGFTPGYKPPASVFNWFWCRIGKCIEEIKGLLKYFTINDNGGVSIGSLSEAGYGSAVGKDSEADYGGAIGYSAIAGNGGAVGKEAFTAEGGAVGENAITKGGGAVGTEANADYGGAVGYGTKANEGGAVGESAEANDGGAVGSSALATDGGAVGKEATADNGGAVGEGAIAGDGFSGGYAAKVSNSVDAIQLGTGTNSTKGTLKVYSYTMMNADGTIPAERMAPYSTTPTQIGTWIDGSPIMRVAGNTTIPEGLENTSVDTYISGITEENASIILRMDYYCDLMCWGSYYQFRDACSSLSGGTVQYVVEYVPK